MGPSKGTFGKSTGGGRRASRRTSAPLSAVVMTITHSCSAALVDISGKGARLSGENLPQVGEDLALVVEGLKLFGRIIWMDDDRRGMAFDEPLRLSEEHLLRRKVAEAAGLTPDLKAALDEWTIGNLR